MINYRLLSQLTPHDLLKSLAIVLMIIDHTGYYFFPDEMWFRVLGRLSVPIWFYLIGYARSRYIPLSWLVGGTIIALASMGAGEFLFPLNILFTLALARRWIDRVMERALKNYEAFAGMFFLLVLAALPTSIAVEYGTIGLLFAMQGFMHRYREEMNIKPWALRGFIAGAAAAYIITQSILLPSLSALQFFVFLGGMIGLNIIFARFEHDSYPRLTAGLGGLALPFKFMGRYTMEIYIIHLLLFKALAMVLDPARFAFMEFQFAPPGLLSLFLLGSG